MIIEEKPALVRASRGPVQLLQEGGHGLAEQLPEVGQSQKEEESGKEDESDGEGMRGGGIGCVGGVLAGCHVCSASRCGMLGEEVFDGDQRDTLLLHLE